MYTIAQIAEIVDGKLHGNGNLEIAHLYTNTRRIQVKENSLFFAIATEKNDGHNYVEHALQMGVTAVVVSKKPSTNCDYILVKDTLVALQQLSSHHRATFDMPTVAITGSNGKTIVKEWLSELVSSSYTVCKNPKSYNSQIGVPLSVWRLGGKDEIAVFEAGISQIGEMVRLERIIQPTVGVFTHLGDAHARNFTTDQEKLAEKLTLFKNCETIIVSANQPDVLASIKALDKKTFTWGANMMCDLHVTRSTEGAFVATYEGNSELISLPFSDKASIENAFTAASAALVLGQKLSTIASHLTKLQPVDMRLQQVAGQNNTQLILDYYNNDYQSVVMALDFVNQQKSKSKSIVILSDILESNLEDTELYANINKLLTTNNIHSLIAIGSNISQQQKSFTLPTDAYATTEEFLKKHPLHTLQNATVLLKGAREFTFEKIADKLKVKTHETKLEVNLTRLQHNIDVVKKSIGAKTKLMAMVKALGYGSGGYQVAKLLEYNRIDYLGVAYTDEAIELRESGISTPIMVLNPDLTDLSPYTDLHIEPVIHSFSSFAKIATQSISVHLEFDTGMHRLGFEEEDVPRLLEQIELSEVKVASVFSHLATSDDPTMDDFTQGQIAAFERIAKNIENSVGYPITKHLSNTAGIERFANARFDMVRLGIGLYGISPLGKSSQLLPVSTFKSFVSQVRTVKAGDGIGYGQHDKSAEDRKIAIVAVGYADGYARAFGQGKGFFMINGKKAPVVGNVCMDMTMCDVTDVACQEGDEVLIFGDSPSVEDLADTIGTIPYEILTSISERVNRVFYQE